MFSKYIYIQHFNPERADYMQGSILDKGLADTNSFDLKGVV